MPISPTNAVSRNLAWSDFTKKQMTAPAPGQVSTAAQTGVDLSYDGAMFDVVKGSKPKVYQLTKEPTVSVAFRSSSFVASFVFDWPSNQQDDLLGHEQVHYLISALSARDFFNAMMLILPKKFAKAATGVAEVAEAQKLLKNQDIQDKYDVDTKHKPTQNAAIQAKWTTAVIGCRASGLPLRPALKTAGLIP